MTYKELLEQDPYKISQDQKERWFCEIFSQLCQQHKKNCIPYKKMLEHMDAAECFENISEIPMIPIQLFKERTLISMEESKVFKEIQSSGTTGSAASRIFLSEEAAGYQQITLYRILQDTLGKKRIPMLIIDSPKVLKNRELFTARGAGILGFSICASKRVYALDDDMNLNIGAVEQFVQEHADEPVLIFGFTYMVWKYLYEPLMRQNKRLNLKQGILFHGGGWKKMQQQAVSRQVFNNCLKERTGVKRVCDYYGMAEQTGCIYVECECGYLHASLYSDVIMRRSSDFGVCRIGEEGMIQVLSPMAVSYPGHSILTQDLGVLRGIDDCACGRKGKYFDVIGRIKSSSVRGCSDTYEG